MGPYSNFKQINYYHLTAKKKTFSQDPHSQWAELLSEINTLASANPLRTHALVMMSNHFHAIISVEDPKAIAHIKNDLSRVWNNGIYLKRIDSFFEYKKVYLYIYRNPLLAGLSSRCEDYPFSSLTYLISNNDSLLPKRPEVVDQLGIFSNPFRVISWLNAK